MKKGIILIFFLAAMFATNWALLRPGFFRVHDFVHAARIAEMLRGLEDGHFPVRWTSNFGFGYGMPLFEFYAPLPYYIGAFFYWIGFNIILSIKALFFICSALTFLGMYLLGDKLFGKAGGILSAVAITVAPYRAVNLYVRGALSEAWGMMAIPWVLLGIVLVIRKEKYGWITLLFGLVILFLSHNLTTLLFFPISGVFALGYWGFERVQKTHSFKEVINSILPLFVLFLTYILGIGLAAFYMFPAYLEKDLTRVEGIFTGYFHYTNHFLYARQFFEDRWGYGGSAIWPYNGISFFLGYGQLFGIAVTIILIVWLAIQIFRKKTKTRELKWLYLFAVIFILMLFSLFMTTFKSQFIWDALPFMVVVQFPWRWLSIASTLLALLVGMGTLLIPRKFLRFVYAAILSIFLLLTNFNYFRPEFYLDTPEKFYYTDPQLIRRDMSQVLNDYVPKQIAFLPKPVYQTAQTTSKYGTVKVTMDRVQDKMIETHFTQPNEPVEVFIADFPGWQLYIDGTQIPKKVGPNGDYLVNVPAGDHVISAHFGDSPIRFWSDTASGISLIILLFLLIGHLTIPTLILKKNEKVTI